MAITKQQAKNYVDDNFSDANTNVSNPMQLPDGRVEITKNRLSDTVVVERFYIDLTNGIYIHQGQFGEYRGSGIIPADYRADGDYDGPPKG